MIKGILLGIFASLFIVSVFFSITSMSGNLRENVITGAVIEETRFSGYFTVVAFLSLIAVAAVLFAFIGIFLAFKKEHKKKQRTHVIE